MPWHDLIHSSERCRFPKIKEVVDLGAEDDSLWCCNAMGCKRLYLLCMDIGLWAEVAKVQISTKPTRYELVPLNNYIKIEGWDDYKAKKDWEENRVEREREMLEHRRKQQALREQRDWLQQQGIHSKPDDKPKGFLRRLKGSS